MWESFWNIIGIVGFFGFLTFAVYTFINSVLLKRRSGLHVFVAGLCLILFVTSTSLFPGEEEIAEEIANPVKIYQRGIENEKRRAFERAKKDYQIVLRLNPQNEEAVEKLELLDRREIALTFLQVAKKLYRKRKFAAALAKLKVAEKIAPSPGTLEDSSNLRNKIKTELSILQQLIVEGSKRKRIN
ncbi:hypothetical protein J7K55_06485 [Candidatus Aerophobetes bacterium]|nr:hypothetical protein [Candidatus Aerophobetes bacterium]